MSNVSTWLEPRCTELSDRKSLELENSSIADQVQVRVGSVGRGNGSNGEDAQYGLAKSMSWSSAMTGRSRRRCSVSIHSLRKGEISTGNFGNSFHDFLLLFWQVGSLSFSESRRTEKVVSCLRSHELLAWIDETPTGACWKGPQVQGWGLKHSPS